MLILHHSYQPRHLFLLRSQCPSCPSSHLRRCELLPRLSTSIHMLEYRGAGNDIRQHAMQLRTRKEPNRWIYFELQRR